MGRSREARCLEQAGFVASLARRGELAGSSLGPVPHVSQVLVVGPVRGSCQVYFSHDTHHLKLLETLGS